jgi:hypothetical protein
MMRPSDPLASPSNVMEGLGVQDQRTPLYMAVSNGRKENALALIGAGADVNVQHWVGGWLHRMVLGWLHAR